MAQTTTRITGVTIKTTRNGDVFKVETASGTEFATFERALGERAKQYVNQDVLIDYTEKQVTKDGRNYTNRYLDDVTAASSQNVQQAFDSWPNQAASDGGEKELRIMRQSAAKVAAQILVHLPEHERTPRGLIQVADFLVDYFTFGQAGDNAYDVTPPHTDEDIPF